MKEVVDTDVNHDKLKHITEKSKKETYFRAAKAMTRM